MPPDHTGHPESAQPDAIPVTPETHHAAVATLLGHGAPVNRETVRRFIRRAPDLGIDLGLMAVVPRADDPDQFAHVCLPVIGAGRTAMLFLSGPRAGQPADPLHDAARAAAVRRAVRLAAARRPVNLVQALFEPAESWASRAFKAAGLRPLAELIYLSRALKLGETVQGILTAEALSRPDRSPWPEGITVRPLRHDDDLTPLKQGLQASYEQTLDCPELAGMRDIDDIIQAHRAVGEFDPSLWWVVSRAGQPEGCVLLNRCPDQECVELVYIGLSPAVRGLRLGEALMHAAIAVCAGLERHIRCAVDTRNTPARRMYERLGFHEETRRIAFVARADDLI